MSEREQRELALTEMKETIEWLDGEINHSIAKGELKTAEEYDLNLKIVFANCLLIIATSLHDSFYYS